MLYHNSLFSALVFLLGLVLTNFVKYSPIKSGLRNISFFSFPDKSIIHGSKGYLKFRTILKNFITDSVPMKGKY